MAVLPDLDFDPAQSFGATAQSSMAEWAIIEGHVDELHALSRNMIQQIIVGLEMGRDIDSHKDAEGEETVQDGGVSSLTMTNEEMAHYLGRVEGSVTGGNCRDNLAHRNKFR